MNNGPVVVIPTREERALSAARTLLLFPGAAVLVPESELRVFKQAAEFQGVRLVAYADPPTPAGTLNAMLEQFAEECVVHVADGTHRLFVADAFEDRFVPAPAESAAAAVASLARCAAEADVGVFGFPAALPWGRYLTFDPFALDTSPGHVWGVRGAARRRRFDVRAPEPRLAFWHTSFMLDRIMMVDQRFVFAADNELEDQPVKVRRRATRPIPAQPGVAETGPFAGLTPLDSLFAP